MLRSLLVLPCLLGLTLGQQCRVPGICDDGPSLLTYDTDVADYNACLNNCLSYPGCLWFSYGLDQDTCFLYSTCPTINAVDCPECLTGQSVCDEYYVCELPGR